MVVNETRKRLLRQLNSRWIKGRIVRTAHSRANTTAQACLSDLRHVTRVTQRPFEKLCDLGAKRALLWKAQLILGMSTLTLTSHTATTPRHRLPNSNDHGLPTCAQVQRLLCRPPTPHNHDHQRRMIHRLETPQELGNISLTYTQRSLVVSQTQSHKPSQPPA